MLTRLKVSGFKNLNNVDVHFGPFTCIAGANGVGKSNLFDAIRFLSETADKTLNEAALAVRDESKTASDIRGLFYRVGDTHVDEMSFEVEMLIPPSGIDDLNEEARATITFLRYALKLRYRPGARLDSLGSLEIVSEELNRINQTDARRNLPFQHKREWRESVVKGERRNAPFISTEGAGEERTIRQHQDGGSRGPAVSRLARNLPRTILSFANAAEAPTALLAKREMQSWELLQLEPTALRRADEFNAPARLLSDGTHLPSTLFRLANTTEENELPDPDRIYTKLSNRVYELIGEITMLRVDRDEKRELLTLQLITKDGTMHPARALSDGTLRFIALGILELDPQAKGLICLEEPENGIHPSRVKSMLQLLQEIAVDPNYPVDDENPLRQVIVNTHSPLVVQQVPEDSLLIASLEPEGSTGNKILQLAALPETWRSDAEGTRTIPLGDILQYVGRLVAPETPADNGAHMTTKRVIDNSYVQPYLPGFEAQ